LTKRSCTARVGNTYARAERSLDLCWTVACRKQFLMRLAISTAGWLHLAMQITLHNRLAFGGGPGKYTFIRWSLIINIWIAKIAKW